MDFLKKYWVELLVTAIVLALFTALFIVAPFLFPVFFAASWPVIVMAGAVFSLFAVLITHGIKTRNEPDWPWFEGITESSRISYVVPAEAGIQPKTPDETKSVSSGLLEPLEPPKSELAPLLSKTKSVKNRIKMFDSNPQIDMSAIRGHSTAAMYAELAAAKSEREERGSATRVKRVDSMPPDDQLEDVWRFLALRYRPGVAIPTLFASKPEYLEICRREKIFEEDESDLSEAAKDFLRIRIAK